MAQIGTAYLRQIISGTADAGLGQASETHIYRVVYDTIITNAVDPRQATGVPAYRSTIGYGLYLLKKDSAVVEDNHKYWDISCEFRSLDRLNQIDNPNSSPSSGDKWNIQITGDWVAKEVPIQKDVNGKIIVNLFGDPIDPPLMDLVYEEQVNVNFYTNCVAWTTLDSCKKHANDASVTMNINGCNRTFATHTLRLMNWGYSGDFDSGGNGVAQVSLRFVYRAETWTPLIPNLSFYHNIYPTGVNKKVPIVDDNGQPVKEPKYIDGAGQIINPGASIYYLGDDGNTTRFENVSDVSFTTLLSGII